MRLRFGLLAIAVAAAVALGSRGAEGSTIIFTDRAAFEAATQQNVLVTFDRVVDDGTLAPQPSAASPIIFTDRTAFNAAASDVTLFPSFTGTPSCDPVTRRCTIDVGAFHLFTWDDAPRGGDALTFDTSWRFPIGGGFLEPVTAFGFDLISSNQRVCAPSVCGPQPVQPVDLAVELLTNNGLSESVRMSAPGFLGILSIDDTLRFVGFAPTEPNADIEVQMDNVAIQTVPEPSTWVMFGIVVALMVWMRRAPSELTAQRRSSEPSGWLTSIGGLAILALVHAAALVRD